MPSSRGWHTVSPSSLAPVNRVDGLDDLPVYSRFGHDLSVSGGQVVLSRLSEASPRETLPDGPVIDVWLVTAHGYSINRPALDRRPPVSCAASTHPAFAIVVDTGEAASTAANCPQRSLEQSAEVDFTALAGLALWPRGRRRIATRGPTSSVLARTDPALEDDRAQQPDRKGGPRGARSGPGHDVAAHPVAIT